MIRFVYRGAGPRRNVGPGKDLRRLGYKVLAQEARISANQDTVRLRLRFHASGNARDSEANVGQRKFVGNDGPPTGGAEFNYRTHLRFSWAAVALHV